MKSVQAIVDEMYNGNAECITRNIFSSNPYFVINSIICGVRYRVNDSDFLTGVKAATSNTQRVLGYPINCVATAALCVLKGLPYTGDDYITKKLVECGFEI